MTTEEFKKLKPEYKDLEGVELLNAIEDFMLRQKQADQIINPLLPLWKTHQLRWLFYRMPKNRFYGKDNYTAKQRCKNCKHGVSTEVGFILQGKFYFNCIYCGVPLVKEPNTSFKHLMWLFWEKITKGFWEILDYIHLVRSVHHRRYDMFGDENMFVAYWTINIETGKTDITLKKRKWYEYIIIPKK